MGATTITQEQIQDHFDTLGYSSKYLKDIEIEHLEQDRQEIWLNIFEKDKRQWVYLFEYILLTETRPKERLASKKNTPITKCILV